MPTIELIGDISPDDGAGFARQLNAWMKLPSMRTLRGEPLKKAQQTLHPTSGSQVALFLKWQDRVFNQYLREGDFEGAFNLADRGVTKARDKDYRDQDRVAAAVRYRTLRGLVRETFAMRELSASDSRSGHLLISAANEYMEANGALGAVTPNAIGVARCLVAVGEPAIAIEAAVNYFGLGEYAITDQKPIDALIKSGKELIQ